MKLRSKEPYWLLKNGLRHSYPSLASDHTCDILVIGSGITGALIAYQLSKEGYKTTLIDKRDVATGSTSATTAMIQYEIDEPLHTLIEKVSKDTAVDSYHQGVAAIDKLEKIVKEIKSTCGFKRKGSLYIASKPDDNVWLQDEFYCRKENGLDVHWLDHVQLKNDFNLVGCGAIQSTAGASMDAYLLTHDLIRYAVEKYSLNVFDHSEVTNIEYLQNGCSARINTSAITINCSRIVHSTGYESQNLISNKKVKLLSTYAFISEPLPELPGVLQQNILWDTDDPYLYARGTDDNRILVGGADEPFKNPLVRDSIIDSKEQDLLEKFKALLPGVNLTPDHAWAGTFGKTPDSLPYIGAHPDFPNSYFVLGFGGNGITFSVMGMQMISNALASKPDNLLNSFRFDR